MTSARVMIQPGDEAWRRDALPSRGRPGGAWPYEWYLSTPASSIVATAEDMGRLLLVHLADRARG